MSNNFEQISIKSGFMKHNGGLLFREISETEYEFKIENLDRPSKAIVYPIAILLLFVFGYLNYRRKSTF